MTHFIRFSFHRLCLIFGLLFLTVGCDQVTKVLARDVLAVDRPLTYFNELVQLEHAENPGAFMSLGSALDSKLRFWIFTIAVALFLGVSLFLLLKKSGLNKMTTLAMTL
ncbi:MAG TPA: signal peptidase II, partial [Bdellovibrio sp.]|nr:signal peptidase II [Bdellovibrio sp.]